MHDLTHNGEGIIVPSCKGKLGHWSFALGVKTYQLWSAVDTIKRPDRGRGVNKELGNIEEGGDDKKQGTNKTEWKERESVKRGVQLKKRNPPESYRLTSTVFPACPQMQESSHRKFSTSCPLCRNGVMLECGQRFGLYALLYQELAFGFAFDTVTNIQMCICLHTHTSTATTILRKMWVQWFAL